MTPTRRLLSGSTDGIPILVNVTSSGTALTVHTAVSGVTDFDEVWLYAFNIGANDVTLNLSLGDTAKAVKQIISANVGLVSVCEGLPLQNGAVVKAWASNATDCHLVGFVNRLDY